VRRASIRASIAAVVLASAASACGGGEGASDPGTASQGAFLAFPSTFDGFRSWQSFPLSGPPIPNSPHTSGPRTVYLKSAPPHGSTEFPVGTLIVKEFPNPPQILAMVKRGGGYNAQGANGWEWFELLDAGDGHFTIKWRGVGPPLGEVYGGDPNGGCNGCHSAARANDFVQASPLTLSNF
jgi:hypothetical protein